MLLAAEAWGVPPWQLDPRPLPRILWFQRWRLLTRLREERKGRKADDPPPPSESDDWEDWE